MSDAVSDAAVYPDACAHELFFERSASQPQRPALLSASRCVSYGELALHSACLARALCADGIGPGTVVGLYAGSSVEAIVGVIAIFKAGGVVVPLDPALPNDRIAFMADDSGAALVVTTADLVRSTPRSLPTRVIDLDGNQDSDVPMRTMASLTLDAPSFVLYTSGSTGRPKGVVRNHRAIVSRLAWAAYQPDDVFCHNMSLNVGFSQERLFLPLMCGLPLAVIDEDAWRDPFRLVDAFDHLAVTQVTLVPDTLRQLVALGPDFTSRLARLRSVAVGSAPLTAELSEAFTARWPGAELVNAYGSTESGSIIRGVVSAAVTSGVVPIGRPVPGSVAVILSPDLQVVPDGEVGELCVGGPSLAIGYVGLAHLETERFIRSSHGGPTFERLYRTGDLARRRVDGSIEVLGRQDRQVKIRGSRIELGEIEAVLTRHDAVADATVIARDDELVAYVVWRQGQQSSETALAEFLAKRLPAVMLPAAFVILDCLPRTLNAKIDVSLLPPPRSKVRRRVPYLAPETETERALAEIWQRLLRVAQVGRHDTFLDLGANSLATTELLIEVQKRWNIELPLKRVLEAPGLAIMSETIDDLTSSSRAALRAIPRSDSTDGALRAPSIVQDERLRFERWADLQGLPYVQAQIRVLLELEGPLNVPALSAALNRVMAINDSFHATFPSSTPSRVPLVRHREPAPITLDITRLDDRADHDSETLADQYIQRVIAKRLDYDAGPLFDAALMRLAPDRHRLLLVVSHLVADALSLQIVQEDLVAEYVRATRTLDRCTLAQAPIAYHDFAEWQRSSIDDVDTFAEAWIPHVTRFERFNLERRGDSSPNDDPLAAASVEVQLSPRNYDRLAKAAADRRVTPYMMLLTAFAMQLRAASGVDDVALMLHFGNRRHPQTRRLVGWLANSFPFGLHLSNECAFDDVLDEVRQGVTTIDRHQHLPLPAVWRAANDLRRARGLPLAEAPPSPPWPRASFEMLPSYSLAADDLTVRSRSVTPKRTEWGLRVAVKEQMGDATAPLTVRAVYSTRLLDESYVRALLNGFRDLIVRVSESPVARGSY